jgi:hypothetical protein
MNASDWAKISLSFPNGPELHTLTETTRRSNDHSQTVVFVRARLSAKVWMSFSPERKEIQKVHTNVLAGLTDAQENQIVAEASFCSNSSDDVPELGEGFDRMLGIVVVPRNSVIV